MTTRIYLDVDSCLGCPKHEKKMGPTAYSDDIWCSLLKRKIKGYVERASEMPPVPNDCPITANSNTIISMKESIDANDEGD